MPQEGSGIVLVRRFLVPVRLPHLQEIMKSRSYHAGIAWLPPEAEQRCGEAAAASSSESCPALGSSTATAASAIGSTEVPGSKRGAAAQSAGDPHSAAASFASIQDFPPGGPLCSLHSWSRITAPFACGSIGRAPATAMQHAGPIPPPPGTRHIEVHQAQYTTVGSGTIDFLCLVAG